MDLWFHFVSPYGTTSISRRDCTIGVSVVPVRHGQGNGLRAKGHFSVWDPFDDLLCDYIAELTIVGLSPLFSVWIAKGLAVGAGCGRCHRDYFGGWMHGDRFERCGCCERWIPVLAVFNKVFFSRTFCVPCSHVEMHDVSFVVGKDISAGD